MSIQNETNSESVSSITSIARIRSDIFSSNQIIVKPELQAFPQAKLLLRGT